MVCLSVCQQDYEKTTSMIFMIFYVRVQHGPIKKPLHCGVDLIQRASAFITIHFVSLRDGAFFDLCWPWCHLLALAEVCALRVPPLS